MKTSIKLESKNKLCKDKLVNACKSAIEFNYKGLNILKSVDLISFDLTNQSCVFEVNFK